MTTVSKGRRRWRRVLVITGLVAIAGGGAALVAARARLTPPSTRLAPGATYPGMPADARHRYVDFPVDHDDSSAGTFRGFYHLSPNFRPGSDVVFFLTDGQMELVGTDPDFSFFEHELPGLSYVLVGHRGHAPTLLPEVYRDGKVDLTRAVRLYGSAQRVEDIEQVRREMVRERLLAPDGRITIFAASGAGVLAQEYLSRHGEHVSRAVLASTGAPDLARAVGWDYARRFADFDSSASGELGEVLRTRNVSRERLTYLLYQLGRDGTHGRAVQRRVLRSLLHHNPLPYYWYSLAPRLNWSLARFLLAAPAADAAKVRMW